MWQLITKFGSQNVLKFAGAWILAHGFATQDQWTALVGGIMALAGVISHWHDLHTHALTTGQVQTPAVSAPVKQVVSLIALCFALAWCSGCSTAQSASYKGTGATIVAVDVAMHEWGAYVAGEKTADAALTDAKTQQAALAQLAAEEQAVKTAYERYQSTMAVVCDAGTVYASAGQTNAPAAAEALQTAIGKANDEINDLERLITVYGVQLH